MRALNKVAVKKPVKAPRNNEGAKAPPTPPAAFVQAMAIDLKAITAARKASNTQILF